MMHGNTQRVSEIVAKGFATGMSQVTDEIEALATFLLAQEIESFMEIGSKWGGTFSVFSDIIDETIAGGLKVSLDLPGGPFGGWVLENHPYLGDVLSARTSWMQTIGGPRTHIFVGDSHSTETRDMVFDTLEEPELDFLFIDGDHTYEGVKKDYEMYSPLVGEGGWIGFHDINDTIHHADIGVDVSRFWNELREQGDRIVFNSNKHWAGIGLIRKGYL
jgi:cephalosporin hydroxylase